MFERTTCDTCGRRFFGAGTALRRFDNAAITVCGPACVTAEAARRDAAYAAYKTAHRARRDAWAADVRSAIAARTDAWRVITVEDVAPDAATLARIGGVPLGCRQWPTHEGQPALHLCTLPGGPLGIAAEGLAVSAHVERAAPDLVLPLGTTAVVPVSRDVVTTVPPLAPLQSLRPSRLTFAAPPPGWDPTAQRGASYVGTVPVTFEGEPHAPAPDAPDRGRFVAQLDGAALPWAAHIDVFGEIAAIYVFERGAELGYYA